MELFLISGSSKMLVMVSLWTAVTMDTQLGQATVLSILYATSNLALTTMWGETLIIPIWQIRKWDSEFWAYHRVNIHLIDFFHYPLSLPVLTAQMLLSKILLECRGGPSINWPSLAQVGPREHSGERTYCLLRPAAWAGGRSSRQEKWSQVLIL